MFIGIPFSQPPVGEFRWKNPRTPLPYEGLYYNATYERDSCIQNCQLPAEEYSCPEEVFYLNFLLSRLCRPKLARK